MDISISLSLLNGHGLRKMSRYEKAKSENKITLVILPVVVSQNFGPTGHIELGVRLLGDLHELVVLDAMPKPHSTSAQEA